MKNKKELHNDKYILDACCGSRMFWFDKSNGDIDGFELEKIVLKG